jgi:hypothetical protein
MNDPGRLRAFLVAALASWAVAAHGAGYGGHGGRNGGTQSQNQSGQNQGQGQNQGPAQNQGSGGGGPGGVGIQGDPLADKMSGPKESAAAETNPETKPEPDPVPELSLEDAAENFKTVVESFVLKKSVDGVWTYKDKKSVARLALVSVDTSAVRAAGKGLYSGDAVTRDLRTKKLRRFLFKVDLSGTEWKVVSIRPSPPPAP